jgi:hypothetical protein
MKKFMMIAMASLCLGACTGWAQTTPTKREHTRPPYSGKRKAGPDHKKSPSGFGSHKPNKADLPTQKSKSGHIIVR